MVYTNNDNQINPVTFLLKANRLIHCQILMEVIAMEDITLVCKDCGEEFLFTVGEQEYYKEKGLENQPKRCLKCRRAKKARMRNNFDN